MVFSSWQRNQDFRSNYRRNYRGNFRNNTDRRNNQTQRFESAPINDESTTNVRRERSENTAGEVISDGPPQVRNGGNAQNNDNNFLYQGQGATRNNQQ